MKLITAVLKPHKLQAVTDALKEAGIAGLTVSEAQGFGRQGGHTEVYRGAEYRVDFIPKIRVEILVDEADEERVVRLVVEAARTGRIGDGKIWTTTVEDLVRIRTGERGPEAIS